MKKLMLFLALLVSTFKANAQLAVEYRFQQNNTGIGVSTAHYVNTAILSVASPVYAGIGLSGVTYSSGASNPLLPTDKAKIASGWGVNLDSTTVIMNDHFGFTLTQLGGTTVVIDSINFWERRSPAGPQNTQIRTSADAYATPIGNWTNSGSAWVRRSITFGLPTFSTPLDIRLYGFNPTDQSGILRIDSVRVYAHLFSPLPVELLYFTGIQENKSVKLSWATATERNNDHFTLFSGSDGQNFEELGRVEGAGDSQSQIDYSFMDDSPSGNIIYYKLRQTDHDGTSKEFAIIAVPFRDVQDQSHRVGDIASITGENSIMYDQIGRILSSLKMDHMLTKGGIFYLQGERGSILRLTVTY